MKHIAKMEQNGTNYPLLTINNNDDIPEVNFSPSLYSSFTSVYSFIAFIDVENLQIIVG